MLYYAIKEKFGDLYQHFKYFRQLHFRNTPDRLVQMQHSS